MNPYKIINKDGFDILFTGILTERSLILLKKKFIENTIR